MDFACDFQPRQIVCLEHESTSLYAEVIQVIESRQMCWVRPLLLVKFGDRTNSFLEPQFHDLRPSSDLVWALKFFRPALDTEVVPFVNLLTSEPLLERNPNAAKKLNDFIQQVWQTYKD